MHAIAFAGPAGAGVNTSGLLLANLLANLGYTVRGNKEYASVIKGGANIFVVYRSSTPSIRFSKKIPHYIHIAKATYVAGYTYFQEHLQEESIRKKIEGERKSKEAILSDKEKKVFLQKNMVAFGYACSLVGIEWENVVKIIHQKFPDNEGSIVSAKVGYDFFSGKPLLTCPAKSAKKERRNILIMGNDLIAQVALDAGLAFYAAYPMTPATSLMNKIIQASEESDEQAPRNETNGKHEKKHQTPIFFQGEDEIAVAMAMLGACFAGKLAMCGTSGGGFALMSESIAFAYQAEIGGIYILVMRDGPSTGTPTFTSQGDLLFACNPTFGDVKPIVLTPSTYEQTPLLLQKVFEWSKVYQTPIIIVIDKQFAESYMTIESKKLKIKKKQVNLVQQSTLPRYALTENGISPCPIPGTPGQEFIATSYEHDEYGATNELPDIKQAMMEKRKRKLITFVQNEFSPDFHGFEIHNPKAEYFFVTFGITAKTIQGVLDTLEQKKGKAEHKKKKQKATNSSWGFIVITVLQPLDPRLSKFFHENKKRIKKIVFVEMNQSGQLEYLIRSNCELYGNDRNAKIDHLRKYSLYPFFAEEIEQKIKELSRESTKKTKKA